MFAPLLAWLERRVTWLLVSVVPIAYVLFYGLASHFFTAPFKSICTQRSDLSEHGGCGSCGEAGVSFQARTCATRQVVLSGCVGLGVLGVRRSGAHRIARPGCIRAAYDALAFVRRLGPCS